MLRAGWDEYAELQGSIEAIRARIEEQGHPVKLIVQGPPVPALPPAGDKTAGAVFSVSLGDRGLASGILASAATEMAAVTGAAADQLTALILADQRLIFPPATLSWNRMSHRLPDGRTVLRKEIQIVVGTPDLSFDDLRVLHRLLREQFDSENAKGLDEADRILVDAVRTAKESLTKPSRPKLFERVRELYQSKTGFEYKDWRGPYQKHRRVLERIARTLTVIEPDEAKDQND